MQENLFQKELVSNWHSSRRYAQSPVAKIRHTLLKLVDIKLYIMIYFTYSFRKVA